MSNVRTTIVTDRTTPGHWRVTLDNPTINAIDDRMYDEFYDLVEEIETAPSLKVVTFESAGNGRSFRDASNG
jgi:enoyl-CoA hydratase/carnithine racemase